MSLNPNFDAEVARNIRSKNASPETPTPSRIEEINAKIAEQERLHSEFDDLIAHFEDGGDSDRKLLEHRAKKAMDRTCTDRDALVRALALEQPATLREVLIFILRALDPVQTALSAALKNDANLHEVEDGQTGYYLLKAVIPALETIAGTTRAELGCDGYYYHDLETASDLIEGLKIPLAKEVAAS